MMILVVLISIRAEHVHFSNRIGGKLFAICHVTRDELSLKLKWLRRERVRSVSRGRDGRQFANDPD